MQRLLLLALASAALTATCTQAHAAEPLTREACITYLTVDPAGPRLDPGSVRIGTEVSLQGVTYRFTETVVVEEVCDQAARRSEELASKDRVIERLRNDVVKEKIQGDHDRAELASMRTDPVVRNAYGIALLAGILAVFPLMYLFYAFAWKPLREWKRRNRSAQKRFQGSGRRNTRSIFEK